MAHDATTQTASQTAAHDSGGHSHVNYFAIFIALCVCTALSVAFDVVDMKKSVVAVLAMAIAVAKAQFVMRYFMHLKFEGLWKYVLLLPTAILATGLPIALAPDIAMDYYPREASRRDAPSAYGANETSRLEAPDHPQGAPVSENAAPDPIQQ